MTHSTIRPTILLALVVCAVVALDGCATKAPVSSEPGIDKTPGVHDQIIQSAARVHALRERMKAAKKPADFTGARMDVFWTGDARDILRQIATQRKLQFIESGPKPYLDVPVDVALRNVTLEEAVRNIGMQAGAKAIVKQYDKKIVLEMKLY